VVIAYFVGGKRSEKEIQEWLSKLGKESGENLQPGNDLRHGFFQIVYVHEAATQKLLMQTLYISRWGTSILQPWMPKFNSKKPVGLKMPILVIVPDLFRSTAVDLPKA
jgi:hypothetical protein